MVRLDGCFGCLLLCFGNLCIVFFIACLILLMRAVVVFSIYGFSCQEIDCSFFSLRLNRIRCF